MDPILLLVVLLGIIVISKIVAHNIKVVDVLLYIIFGFIFAKLNLIDSKNEIFLFLSEIGIIFLMFYAGWHEDSKTFFKKVLKNKWIAIFGAIGPFIGAFLGIKILGFSFNEAIIGGFIFTATAVPYTIAIFHSLKLGKIPGIKSIFETTHIAQDMISIVSISALFSSFILFQSGKNIDIYSIFIETGFKLFLLFLCFSIFFILAVIIFPQKYPEKDFGNKYLNKAGKVLIFITESTGLNYFTKKFYKVEIMIPITLLLLFSLSYFSHYMGLHVAIGAYLTGLILNVDMFHSPIKNTNSDKYKIIDSNHGNLTVLIYFLANHFLGPIFFIYLGSELLISFDNFYIIFLYSFILFTFIAFFQFTTAFLPALFTTKLNLKDSVLVGFGMWPRDVIAFVILGIAINAGLINESSMFISIVILSIIFLNIATPICLKWWVKKHYS